MSVRNPLVRLWLIFDGPSGDSQVRAASLKAPKRGRRAEVRAPASVIDSKLVWLLVRTEPRDIVLAVGAEKAPLEAQRAGLGKLRDQYEVVKVPVVERSPEEA